MNNKQTTEGNISPAGKGLPDPGAGSKIGSNDSHVRNPMDLSAVFAVKQPEMDKRRTDAASDDTGQLIKQDKVSILYVDDDIVQVKLVVRMLERLGYQIAGTDECREALAMVRDGPDRFDLIISDLTMPNMCGRELCRQIRKVRPDMPIILCTGYGMLNDRYFEDGLFVDAYLSKPFTMRRINDLIRKVLKKKDQLFR